MITAYHIAEKLNAFLCEECHNKKINEVALNERLIPSINAMLSYYGDHYRVVAIIGKDLKIIRFDITWEDQHIIIDPKYKNWLKKD